MNIINISISPIIHCLQQLPVHTVVKFILSVVWDKHHLLHPLGSLNVLRPSVGWHVQGHVTHHEDNSVWVMGMDE